MFINGGFRCDCVGNSTQYEKLTFLVVVVTVAATASAASTLVLIVHLWTSDEASDVRVPHITVTVAISKYQFICMSVSAVSFVVA